MSVFRFRWIAALPRTAVMIAASLVSAVTILAAQPDIVESAFESRSGPRGRTMFVEIPASQSGVITENSYADPSMWAEHFREFSLGAIGTGVAVGDYDNDGKPDIFVVSKTGPCRLFRNLGNWKFEDVTDKAGIRSASAVGVVGASLGWLQRSIRPNEAANSNPPEPWKQGATFVDVNNDGWLDIYVCRNGAPNLLFINQHDGTFKEEASARGLAVVDGSNMAAFADYDRDGWLDVYVQTNLLVGNGHADGQRDYLFHNNGDGTFTNVTEAAGIRGETQGHSVTWWDFDGDGWPDIYVANDFAAPDFLYRNNRDGTFTNVIQHVAPHVPYSSMGADLGDVNNDGLIDFFVAEMAASGHEKDQRGTVHARSQSDANRANQSSPPQYAHNALFINTGTGVLQEAAYLAGIASTDWTWSVRFEDLDNDGRLDLFVTNGVSREFNNADLRDRLMQMEDPLEHIRAVRASPVLAENHLAFRNLGDLKFENVSAAWGLGEKGVSFGAAFADFDGDGDLDLVYSNYERGVTLMRNDSDSGHRIVVALRGTVSNRFGIGSIVHIETKSGVQVRPLVLARGYLSSSEPIVHFGLGDDTEIEKLSVCWPNGYVQNFSHLAVDRRFTITEPRAASDAKHQTEQKQNEGLTGIFYDVSESVHFNLQSRESPVNESMQQPFLPFRQNGHGPSLAIGDVNGDGRDDVVIGGTTQDPLRILLMEPDHTFRTEAALPLNDAGPVNDGPVLLFDADGDGRNDLLVTKSGAISGAASANYQLKLLINDGLGGFKPLSEDAIPKYAISVGAVAAADFDKDGKLDLFIGGRDVPGQYPLAPVSALWRNRGGKFDDVTDSIAPSLRNLGRVTAALWTDVDGDGWVDLLVTVEWGNVKYFHNGGGKNFEDWSEKGGFSSAGTGLWTSLTAADFNGDGKMDYVVGNLGLNTQYRADPAHPALLYYGNFGGTRSQIVEGYYEGDMLYPWRARTDLGAHIPSILKKFPRNNIYARASLTEIIGEDRLQSARRYAATELRSGVFLSQPDGTYRFEPMPRMAQISPTQGMAAGDFDGDGKADIYLVQNWYAGVFYDGGVSQLLRGDGQGHFAVVPPKESGLIVTGDAKALVVADLDGDGRPDFLVTRNDGATAAFQNRGLPGRKFLRLDLRGPRGNPTAIGARVSAQTSDGQTQMAEVYAGSGYMSQSSAACFFGYLQSRPLTNIHVRWPSGAEQDYLLPTVLPDQIAFTEGGH